MNKNLVIIGIIVLVLLAGGAYLMMGKKSATLSPGTSMQTAPTIAPTSAGTTMKSIKDLLASGVAQKCTFSDSTATGSVTGTTYISSGKMRGDFDSTYQGKTTSTHMIIDGKAEYVWLDGQTSGFKIAYDIQNIKITPSQQQSVDLNKSFNYTCSGWLVDGSQFTPPSNLKFTDYGTMTIPSAGATNCSVCDSLSGMAQSQCKSALHCN